jgi:hypothetical protein
MIRKHQWLHTKFWKKRQAQQESVVRKEITRTLLEQVGPED